MKKTKVSRNTVTHISSPAWRKPKRPVKVNWVAGKPALMPGPWRPNKTRNHRV